MSHTQSTGAPSRRDVSNILKGAAGALSGGRRGPDQGEGRRVPHRHSYDEHDPRAKPWARIGDGTVGEGLAHRDALIAAAEEMYRESWRELPHVRVRLAREEYAALNAELEGGGLPIGRPAAIRLQLSKLRELIDRARDRLRRIDVTVLKALVQKIDFATGALFPSIDRIAGDAGCHRNSAIAALRRLKKHGFIDWVRRTTRTGNDGEFAPQREQTSNAYFFDHRRRMAERTWQRFWQLLQCKLRRLGPKRPPQGAPEAVIQSPELRATLARVSALIPNAST